MVEIETGPARAPGVMQVLPRLGTGGVERGAVDIAAALVAAGWRAVVVSEGGPLSHQVERSGGLHVRLPVHAKNPLVMARNALRLSQLIERHDIDIVHARSRAPAFSAFAAARRARRRFVTTFHGTYDTGTPAKLWYSAIMTRGDRIIAISDFIARHIQATYGVDAARIATIHRGVDTARFDPVRVSGERMVRLANEWRLPDGVPVVMMPGRLSRWKGHRVFVEALARLGRDDVRCLIVGVSEGSVRYRRELDALIAARGLGPIVHMVDRCEDMPAAYMMADVVVSASTNPEAFGRVAAEAQAMGRPVIAADHGGARETVVPGETGWLVAPGDPAALAETIAVALALEPAQRAHLGQLAREHICATFTADLMCARTLDLYRELLIGR
jgi:glycosyltransferase involved in cell wall biosynthesis